MSAVHANVADGPYTGAGEEVEAFGRSVEAIKAFFGADPNVAVGVFVQGMDEIAADAGAVVGIVAEDLEGVTVEAVEPVFGAEPEEPPFVLEAADDGIIGETVLHLQMAEIIRLPQEGGARNQGEEGEYAGFGCHYR